MQIGQSKTCAGMWFSIQKYAIIPPNQSQRDLVGKIDTGTFSVKPVSLTMWQVNCNLRFNLPSTL